MSKLLLRMIVCALALGIVSNVDAAHRARRLSSSDSVDGNANISVYTDEKTTLTIQVITSKFHQPIVTILQMPAFCVKGSQITLKKSFGIQLAAIIPDEVRNYTLCIPHKIEAIDEDAFKGAAPQCLDLSGMSGLKALTASHLWSLGATLEVLRVKKTLTLSAFDEAHFSNLSVQYPG